MLSTILILRCKDRECLYFFAQKKESIKSDKNPSFRKISRLWSISSRSKWLTFNRVSFFSDLSIWLTLCPWRPYHLYKKRFSVKRLCFLSRTLIHKRGLLSQLKTWPEYKWYNKKSYYEFNLEWWVFLYFFSYHKFTKNFVLSERSKNCTNLSDTSSYVYHSGHKCLVPWFISYHVFPRDARWVSYSKKVILYISVGKIPAIMTRSSHFWRVICCSFLLLEF